MRPDDTLAMAFVRKYPIDAARLLESMGTQQAATLLFPFNPELIAHVLQYVLPATSSAILQSLPEKMVIESIPHMSTTAAIGIIRQSDREWQAWILGKLDAKMSSPILKAFSFPDRSAGRLADPRVLIFTADRTISDAIQWVRGQPTYDAEDLFILDRRHRLIGKITLRSLIITDLDCPIEKIMLTNLETLSAELKWEDVLNHRFWQRAHTLPVIDTSEAFLGIIRYQSLLTLTRSKEGTDKSTQLNPEGTHSCNEQAESDDHDTVTNNTSSVSSDLPLDVAREKQIGEAAQP